jgi:hypothetical protein
MSEKLSMEPSFGVLRKTRKTSTEKGGRPQKPIFLIRGFYENLLFSYFDGRLNKKKYTFRKCNGYCITKMVL